MIKNKIKLSLLTSFLALQLIPSTFAMDAKEDGSHLVARQLAAAIQQPQVPMPAAAHQPAAQPEPVAGVSLALPLREPAASQLATGARASTGAPTANDPHLFFAGSHAGAAAAHGGSTQLSNKERTGSAVASSQVGVPHSTTLAANSSGVLINSPLQAFSHTPMEQLGHPRTAAAAAEGSGPATAAARVGNETATFVSISVSALGAAGAGASAPSVTSLQGFPVDWVAEDESKEDLEAIIKGLEATKLTTKQVALARTYKEGDNSPLTQLVEYTQSLSVQGRKLACNRKSTQSAIEYVLKANGEDGRTHLLAQTICMGTTIPWSCPLTAKMGFPNVPTDSLKRMDWVSNDGQSQVAQRDGNYYFHPSSIYGGHAEPQLISDLEAIFARDPGEVAKLFIPSANTEAVYMCGLEIFGTYDMCDVYDRKPNSRNQYNCVGQLCNFRMRHQNESVMEKLRKEHQTGQKSISSYIRDKLKDRFKGKQDEDAFVVIYHAQQPYYNIYTYRCEDSQYSYPLTLGSGSAEWRFSRANDFDDTFELFQPTVLTTRPHILYGYIHHLANRKAQYSSQHKYFSFPSPLPAAAASGPNAASAASASAAAAGRVAAALPLPQNTPVKQEVIPQLHLPKNPAVAALTAGQPAAGGAAAAAK